MRNLFTGDGVFGARAHSYAIPSHKADSFGLELGIDSVWILGILALLHSSVSEMAFNMGWGAAFVSSKLLEESLCL